MKTPARLLCIGECMVELSPAGDDKFRMGFAGDTFNTAWYVKQLLGQNWRIGYASCVGTDAVSERMLAFMREAGIDTDHVRQLRDRTAGLYMIQLENGERSFSYWRGQSAARMLADESDWLDRAFSGADVLFYSGITMAILDDPARERLSAALARARARGALTVFDSNMRTQLWNGPDAMRAGIMQGAAQADVVLPSFDDEQDAFADTTLGAVARRYREAGAKLVVIKNGAGKILVSRHDGEDFSFAPDPVRDVLDSTAAGDSFNAGFLSAYLQGADVREAVARGAEVAAKVVRAPGALVTV
ncbi:sugar kinase [Alisedimentitalea sp. MJ-SS2]|uniref:sugar kinase n=1 Tax=Aliisedimentitalea sp. MJ-SS2 TaxID=3049795 RepID=UPI00290BDAFA|nr:sugar kinase [Alisedimentitalea sp. MJ-SS2]MDU8927046.1 sugar kinase [Alisedimentitalea sp. MJ-SS2]